MSVCSVHRVARLTKLLKLCVLHLCAFSKSHICSPVNFRQVEKKLKVQSLGFSYVSVLADQAMSEQAHTHI